jgi:VCBS repeat-containing protein
VTSATADHGQVVINASGTLTYTPAAHYNGLDTLRYTILDGASGTASSTVAVTVAPALDLPSRTLPTLQLRLRAPEGTLTFNTAANVTLENGTQNATGTDGDALHVVQVQAQAGLVGQRVAGSHGGTFQIEADGAYRFDPGSDFADLSAGDTRTTAVHDQISDGQGGVEVTGTDPDGGTLVFDTTATVAPVHGRVVIGADGVYTYTPDPDYNGPDSFQYTVRDPQGQATTGTVTLTVGAVNDAPVAQPAALPDRVIAEGAAVSVPNHTSLAAAAARWPRDWNPRSPRRPATRLPAPPICR